MIKKRKGDSIKEIIDIRNRRQWGNRHDELRNRLNSLERAFKKKDTLDSEFLRYFPISLVACIESYFRHAIQEFIDHGEPYFENCSELLKNNDNFNFEVIKALQGNKISVGEFISHLVPINNLSNIDATMSTLIKDNYLKRVETVCNDWDRRQKGITIPIIENPAEVYKSVAKIFELRHIFCHEFASSITVLSEEIDQLFNDTLVFIKACEELNGQILHPNAPLTQREMTEQADNEFRSYDDQMKELNLQFLEKIKDEDSKIEYSKAHESWLDYRKHYAEFIALRNRGGTIWPMVYAKEMSCITYSHIQVLVREIKNYGYPDNY
jgi:uncharacterized protein YecT (DUF1311 family)